MVATHTIWIFVVQTWPNAKQICSGCASKSTESGEGEEDDEVMRGGGDTGEVGVDVDGEQLMRSDTIPWQS